MANGQAQRSQWAIIEEIEKLRDEAQVFVGPGGGQGLPTGKGGSLGGCDDVMRRCVGAAILDFPKWRFSIDDRDFRQLCPVAVEQRRNHACTTTIVVGVPVTWHPRTDPFVTDPFVSHSRTRL
jgi:hypothetical protein